MTLKPLKWFRWKAVIPLLITVIAATVICIFLLDWIVKSVFIAAGQAAFGAKVEVEKVTVGIRHPGITIKSLHIADKSDPWKDLFAADEIKFGMSFYPLLSKKLIINDMSMSNIRWGTSRAASGALPPAKAKKIKKKEEKEDKNSFTYKLSQSMKQKMSAEISALPAVKSGKEIEGELKTIDVKKIVADYKDNLASKKTIETLQKESAEKSEKYKSAISNLKLDEVSNTLKQASADISSIKVQSVQDAGPAGEKISKVSAEARAADEALAKLKAIQASASADFIAEKELAAKINSAFGDDYRALLSMAKLPEINKSNIASAIFGKMWLEKVNSTLRYIHLARKYFPPRKKQQAKAASTRARGTDIIFYRENVLPGFLLRMAGISGTTGGEGKDASKQIDISGKITDVCSDPVLYGKPAIMAITGRKGAQKYDLNGIFDHTKDIPLDTITLAADNVAVGAISLGGNGYVPDIEKGIMKINSSFSLTGENIDCRMEMSVSDIKFAAVAGQTAVNEIITDIISGIKTIKITAALTGTMNNLKTSVSSNLDSIISDKIKSIYGKKAEEFKARLKDELDKYVSAEKEKVLKGYPEKRQEILALISGKDTAISAAKKEVDDKIAAVKTQIEQIADGEKKKLEQKALEEKKKKEEELKNKAEEELKKKAGDLFK